MAEFVEFRAEEWLTELEQMERIHLFDAKEIKSIATKRKELEYKIQRKTQCKEDYLKYIQYEVDLHRIIKARRDKTGINSKRAEIEHSQTDRIARLFKRAIFRFQSDIKLWMSFFKFCKEVKFHSLVSQMLVKMLQVHSDKEDLWVFSAKWEFEQCKSIDNARQFLTRGLRHHPSSKILYTELFRLELEHIKKKRKEKELKIKKNEWVLNEVEENIISGKVAEIIYNSAVKCIEGVDFKVDLLNICKSYKQTIDLQKMIFQDLMKNHPMEELTWDAKAKLELQGVSFDLSSLNENNESMEVDSGNEKEKKSLRQRLQKSVDTYEEAVRTINTPKMWSYYLDHVIEINEDVTFLQVFKSKLLNNALEGALASGNMNEKYYIHWVEILRKHGGKPKKLGQVLEKGTEAHPSSLQLWHARLRFHLSRDQEEIGAAVFEEAIKKLPNALPVWKLMIQYYKMKSSPKIEEVFQNGISQRGEIALALKPLYIEWLCLSKGIDEARKAFETPEFQHPPCLEMYNKMAGLECSQPSPCLKRIRKCHELACSNFGKDDPNVWLEYVKFEMKQGDVTKVDQIYRRAVKALDAEQSDDFIEKFNFFKTNSACT